MRGATTSLRDDRATQRQCPGRAGGRVPVVLAAASSGCPVRRSAVAERFGALRAADPPLLPASTPAVIPHGVTRDPLVREAQRSACDSARDHGGGAGVRA